MSPRRPPGLSEPPARARGAVAAPNASGLARADGIATVAAVPKLKAPSWPQPGLSCHEPAGRSRPANGAQQHDPATRRPRHCPEVVRAKLGPSAHAGKHLETPSQAVTPDVTATEASPVT